MNLVGKIAMNKINIDNLGETLEEKVFEERYGKDILDSNKQVFCGIGVKRNVWISQYPVPNVPVHELILIDDRCHARYPNYEPFDSWTEEQVKELYDSIRSKEDVKLLIEAIMWAQIYTKKGRHASFEGLYKVLAKRDRHSLMGDEGV